RGEGVFVRHVSRHAVQRAEAGLLLREESGHVLGARQAVAERRGQALLDPVLRIEVERVAQHHADRALGIAQRDAAAARGFVVGDEVECRLQLPQLVQGNRGHAQFRRKLGNVLGHHGQRMLPASSKIGMYMSTAISTGSNALVNHSMVRATSSSWKRAICASIWPMSPVRSPTTIMRAATGVARPTAPSAADIAWPCSMRVFALESAGRRCAASRPCTMSSARTAGIPARSSMAAVRYRRASW